MKQKWFSAGVFLALVFCLLAAWPAAQAGAQAKLLDEDFACHTVIPCIQRYGSK